MGGVEGGCVVKEGGEEGLGGRERGRRERKRRGEKENIIEEE